MEPEKPIEAAPLLKWAGGKRQILPAIREHVPATFGRYFEPFVGGGAVFFDLFASDRIRSRCYLGDSNAEMMTTYQAVRDDVDSVIGQLQLHAKKHSVTYYYEVRASDPARYFKGKLLGPMTAARMIYLNRTCYNGLYRVSKAGRFNVPIGRYANPTICDEPNLRACSEALEYAELITGDFASVMAPAGKGDFVYFDPPYVPVNDTSDFTAFTATRFTMEDQERLAACARKLKKEGAHVLLSNADLPVVRKLYEGFEMERVEVRRHINSKGGKRGAVGELLIW